VINDQQSNLERLTGEGIENFSLSSVHAAKPVTPKQIPSYNEYIPVEKIASLRSNSAKRQRPKSRRKHTASALVSTRTSHKESLNRPNISGLPIAKPKRQT
jgi:hypothetical protein